MTDNVDLFSKRCTRDWKTEGEWGWNMKLFGSHRKWHILLKILVSIKHKIHRQVQHDKKLMELRLLLSHQLVAMLHKMWMKRSLYRVCQGFRLKKSSWFFWVTLDHLELASFFEAARWGSSENWIKPKSKPP